jgi:hypothetical protein
VAQGKGKIDPPPELRPRGLVQGFRRMQAGRDMQSHKEPRELRHEGTKKGKTPERTEKTQKSQKIKFLTMF